jgi:hypothetical protein
MSVGVMKFLNIPSVLVLFVYYESQCQFYLFILNQENER